MIKQSVPLILGTCLALICIAVYTAIASPQADFVLQVVLP
jgi:hypothetical protein